jgi:hypothetical protein
MESFQKIVLLIAIIILVIILVIVGYTLIRHKKSTWPPLIGDCPDYWVDLSGNGANCINVKNLGNGNCNQSKHMDFTQPIFSGSNGLCAKYNWANNCGVSWDGITYGVSNPCDTSSN